VFWVVLDSASAEAPGSSKSWHRKLLDELMARSFGVRY
jgi:hypothetical protein